MKKLLLFMFFSVALNALGAQSDPVPMIVEGRVWEYFKYGYKMTHAECALEKYSFIGTEEINGKIYHRCVLLDITDWKTPEDYLQFDKAEKLSSRTINECVGLLREENGKIFMLLEEENVNFTKDYITLENRPVTAGEEVLLMDFKISQGETIDCYIDSKVNDNLIAPVYAAKVEEEPTDYGFSRRKITLENADISSGSPYNEDRLAFVQALWLEGIGNIGEGGMLDFGGIEWILPDCYCWNGGYINNLYDASGEVIYKGADHKRPQTAAVNDIDRNLSIDIDIEKDLIRVDSAEKADIFISGTDGLSRVLSTGKNNIEINTATLEKGVYILRIITESGSVTKKIRI